MNFILKNRHLLIISILYSISNFVLLINNGIYWDDWCLSTPEGIRKMLTDSGTPYMIPVHLFLTKSIKFYPLIYHILVFIFEIVGITLVYQIFKKLNFRKFNIFILVLLYAILPYNISKIYICTFSYSLGLLIFNISLYLFINAMNFKSFFTRFFILILFFISFFYLPSLLVFYLGIIIILILQFSYNKDFEYFDSFKIVSFIDFIILPFIKVSEPQRFIINLSSDFNLPKLETS